MSNRPNKFFAIRKITKPPELTIPKDNLYVSVLTGLYSSLENVTPEHKRILCKNKSKETPAV